MRLNVALKLGFWLALFGILSTALTGYYVYTESRKLLTRSAEQKLLTATQVLARRINYSLEQTVNDVKFIAALPGVRQLADPHLPAARRRAEEIKLEEIFFSLLASHVEYFQIRFIGAANNGRELVRVDRDDAGIQAVRASELQEKGHFPYVYDSLAMPDGELYFSRINLNREQGAHQGLNKPTLRIATAIRAANGDVFGILIINVDLDGMFNRLRTDIPDDISVLLANDEGDYLIHPDAAKTFGFDQGRRILIQDDIKEIRPVLERKKNNLVLTVAEPEGDGRAVGAFLRVAFGAAADHRFMLLGLVAPLEKALQDSRMLGVSIMQITVLFSLLALIISLVLSRVLTQPLHAMARALAKFDAGKPMPALPVDRNDEIGYLAKSFQSMAVRLNLQVGDLQSKQLQLDYMAHHDYLTGLPNRILFLDRLVQAINKAHRNGEQFAVMFIDLDRFKEINDSLGHHVGDDVLKQAASRMQSIIRQEDTISRLGGDEFAIIVEHLQQSDQYTIVAEKLVALFAQPIRVGAHAMELTCSIGISIYPQHGSRAEELLNNADAAMYRAKKRGRNCHQVWEG